MSPPPKRVEIGDFVFWDRSTHPEEVWQVVPPTNEITMSAAIKFVVGPPLRNPQWVDRSALRESLTKISPLELLALVSRSSEEWKVEPAEGLHQP